MAQTIPVNGHQPPNGQATGSDSEHEAVAIVGMACRTAGGNDTPEKLWQFLLDKKHGSGEVPAERWDPWLRRDPRNAKEIEKTLRKGYFIQGLENFDASFFGISPKEAEQMDPHQRLALELAWEALEHAGISPKDLAKSNTAVYMGVDSDDYSRLVLEDLPNIEPWMGIGTAAHGVSNRISYHLDLMGPSAAVDAACASSLVAIHCGRQAIQLRESEVALVGGVNVLLAPALTRMLEKTGALSPEGLCRSFDDAADGYARGEGGAVLVLKRLSSALRDGDHIWSVLKGTAVAQDGKTNGIMAPNRDAQELVGRQALSRAEIEPSTVGYVEAHATSTPLGDPTEIAAIARLYGSDSRCAEGRLCMVGSIKPNVGHLEAAAGAIGLIKAVIAVDKGQLAPQTLLNKLNSKVDWETSGLEVVRETKKWIEPHGLRRAAVCSYGYGGTVSHAIIEEYRPTATNGHREHENNGHVLLCISAPHEKRLAAQAESMANWLASPAGQASSLEAVANTLAQRRAWHDHRLAIPVRGKEDAINLLNGFAGKTTQKNDPVVAGHTLTSTSTRATSEVWIFSGHGAQWTHMGRELMHDKVFSKAIGEIEDVVQEEGGFSLGQALEVGDIEITERAQIATFAVQYGLACLLLSKGLRPKAVIGHSIGEICASVLAGCIAAREGALIIIRRAKLLTQVRQDDGPGAMALVMIPFAQVKQELGQRTDLVAAIDSSPRSCVVSGEAEAVAQYVEKLRSQDVETFPVKTDIAFHSPMLDRVQTPLRDTLNSNLKPEEPSITIYSTSLEDPRGRHLRDADYWVNNMMKPVQLRHTVQAAADDGYRTFLEVSSHPIVLHSVRETLAEQGLKEKEIATACTMRRDTSPSLTIGLAMARLWVQGTSIEFSATLGHKSHWCRSLPNTPWSQKPYYRQVETGNMNSASLHDSETHSLLGEVTTIDTHLELFSTRLSIETKPFPGTHPLHGTEIIPAAVFINTFHHATGGRKLVDIDLRVPLPMTTDIRKVQVVVQGGSVSMASTAPEEGKAKESWIDHAACKWSLRGDITGPPIYTGVLAVKKRIGVKLPRSFAVDFLTKIGVEGIAFPWQVVEHYGNEAEMIVEVDVLPDENILFEDISYEDDFFKETPMPGFRPRDTLPKDRFSFAPWIDAATSVASSIFFKSPSLRIISYIGEFFIHTNERLPKMVYLHVKEASNKKSLAAHVDILDQDGKLLAQLKSMTFSEVEGSAGLGGDVGGLVHQIDWIPAQFSEVPRRPGNVVVVSSDMDRFEVVRSWMGPISKSIIHVDEPEQLKKDQKVLDILSQRGSSVVYLPGSLADTSQVSSAAELFVWEAATILQTLASHSLLEVCKMFILTEGVYQGETKSGLAQGALVGLGRIIAAEHPDTWGGLIDSDSDENAPVFAMMYVRGHDILRSIDGIPRRAIMRPLSQTSRSRSTLLPEPAGTYLITGGLGSLGLDTADFLVKQGARRILLVSRRSLPTRSRWSQLLAEKGSYSGIIQRILNMEDAGAAVHTLALDIADASAPQALFKAIDIMQLPRVRGVVHCAGVLEDNLALETSQESFRRVMAPKVRGAMALHEAFPVGSVDFFVLYSSIGQLVGTAGQASYGAGNAFLDGLAEYRSHLGCNAVAMQFTAWRDSAMGSSTDFLTAELESKGITDITSEEAFRAWERLGKSNRSSAVVTRCLAIDEGGNVAVPILEEVVIRRKGAGTKDQSVKGKVQKRPKDPEGMKKWLGVEIRQCIAAVLLMPDIAEIDGGTTMNDLGIDSVMTVALRRKFQDFFQIKVPPTLTWKYPTVDHMIPWFEIKLLET